MVADHSLRKSPNRDPGRASGFGNRSLLVNEELLDGSGRSREDDVDNIRCTGSLILGAAGILKGLRCDQSLGSHHRLAESGIPTRERVVEEGSPGQLREFHPASTWACGSRAHRRRGLAKAIRGSSTTLIPRSTRARPRAPHASGGAAEKTFLCRQKPKHRRPSKPPAGTTTLRLMAKVLSRCARDRRSVTAAATHSGRPSVVSIRIFKGFESTTGVLPPCLRLLGA